MNDRNAAKKKASKRFDQNIFTDFIKKRAVATNVLKQAKRSFWRKFCSSLNEHSKLSKVWKLLKVLIMFRQIFLFLN